MSQKSFFDNKKSRKNFPYVGRGGRGSTNIWKIPYVLSFLFLKASLNIINVINVINIINIINVINVINFINVTNIINIINVINVINAINVVKVINIINYTHTTIIDPPVFTHPKTDS